MASIEVHSVSPQQQQHQQQNPVDPLLANLRGSTQTSESCEPVELNDLDSTCDSLTHTYNPESLVEIYTEELTSKYPNTIKSLRKNDQLHRLQTIIRDVKSTRSEFVFAADRLIRLVIEAGLDLLPISDQKVVTSGGYDFNGSTWTKSSCGVSIIRSGEAMENGLRDCCRSIRIGKILIQTDEETGKAQVYYSKFPPLINKRIILLRDDGEWKIIFLGRRGRIGIRKNCLRFFFRSSNSNFDLK